MRLQKLVCLVSVHAPVVPGVNYCRYLVEIQYIMFSFFSTIGLSSIILIKSVHHGCVVCTEHWVGVRRSATEAATCAARCQHGKVGVVTMVSGWSECLGGVSKSRSWLIVEDHGEST